MRAIGRIAIWVWMLVLIGASTAWAHKPIFSDGSADDADSAIQIDDVTISQVTYHEVTEGATQVWLTFEGQANYVLTVQLGVPFIERLADFRPAVVVVGRYLTEADLPLEVPPGMGAAVWTTDDVAEPEFFHEPFTGTDSWILGEFQLALPATGRYYVAAYVPSGETGKLWVAVGEREQFGLEDILSLPAVIARVREFHEVPIEREPCMVAMVAVCGVGVVGLRFVTRRGG
ncbi:MAG TPA: hypothetical protein VMZ31_12965 [Phycisphaerae bacterium]|nr:hypothetical protein [Phycisphaerae bacterium]